MKKIIFIITIIVITEQVFAQSFANYGVDININQGTSLLSGIDFKNEVNGNVKVLGMLTTESSLTNNGEINIENGGSLLDNGTISGTGIFNVRQDISNEFSHYISSPINGALVNVFAGAYVDRFDETVSDWVALVQGNTLSNMQGYSVRYLENTTVNFNGNINTGNKSIALSMLQSGWNLAGNPYPSAIDWDANGWTKTNVDNSVYFWNGVNYAVYNGTTGQGTNNATQYIPPMQGYFVHCNSTTGTLASQNVVRLHNNQAFNKKAKKVDLQKIKLQASGNSFTDDALILFSENASNSLESDYDAVKLFSSNNDVPQIYTLTATKNKLAINTLQTLNKDISIPLCFKSGKEGVYTISLAELTLENNFPVYITDLKENKTIELSQKSEYSFLYNTNDLAERFLIHFKGSATAVDEISIDKVQVFANDNIIIINVNANILNNSTVTVYNYLGKKVHSEKLVSNQTYLSINNASGIYLVKIINGNQTINRKVFISK